MPDEGAAQKCGDSTRSVGSLGDLEDSASDASGRTVQSARRFDSAVKSSDVHAIRLPGVDVGKPHDRSVLSTVMLRRTVETKEIRPEERTMKLNLFAAWASYFLVLATVVCLGSFLVAAGSGHGGWALIAGLAGVASIGLAVALYTSTVHHDHKVHRESPHLF
ncbi:hypothetical protein G9444_1741 [Rhodococcus erythropolis]|uniref:Uncharacterized protein n=3 Tax=Rhodococcus erythropolis group TaxID=2840174 RepID=A0A6G9CPL5_RHOER|nr:hypothetical protein G9444_1741 [Rhodococcus erythropolis]